MDTDTYQKRRKINPSKSRQGRAVMINGALRNPYMQPSRPSRSYGRNPAKRKHPRTLPADDILLWKEEAMEYAEVAKQAAESANYVRTENKRRVNSTVQFFESSATMMRRLQRRAECLVSRELDQRWTVGTVEGEETFTVKEAA